MNVTQINASHDAVPVLHDASIVVEEGEMMALLGPSGCGKTTLLRVIAGLHRADSGTVVIGDQTVTSPGTFINPEQRRVGMLFQDGALFPHLTAAENVRFGLRGRSAAKQRTSDMLDLVGMGGYADRLPGTLSGGQQQRVALARALAPEPAVLLLDEPFSALDAGLRVQVRRDVKRILADVGVTTILVTHDQDEAFSMGDRVAVMSDGIVVQEGTPSELYERPANPWVAGFVGEANLIDGQYDGTNAETAVGSLVVRGDGPAGDVQVLIRPEQLAVVAGSAAVIDDVEYYGHDARYDVRILDRPGEPTLGVRMTLAEFQVGDRVDVKFVGSSVQTWPTEQAGDSD